MTTLTPPTQSPSTASPSRAPAPPSNKRKKPSQLWLVHVGLLLICCGFLLPIGWMLSTSLKTLEETMVSPPTLLPHPVQWGNLARVWVHPRIDFPLYTHNSLTVCLLAVVGTLVSSSLVAYGFARIEFRGRNLLFAVMLATMMVPFPVLMVSLFSIYRWVGDHTPIQILGTFRPLWLPWWFGSAFNIFMLRQFFTTIPNELSEAARIDGCGELAIFLRVILPLAKPALAVIALFTFLATWNDFVGPLVFLQRPEQYTLALGLQAFQMQHGGTEWNLLMAASVLVILPVLALFFLAQKTFIRGIATTGLK